MEYFVKTYRSKSDIANSATKLRKFLDIDHLYTFNIVKLIREKMVSVRFPLIGIMRLRLFKAEDYPNREESFIKFGDDEFTLYVEEETWELAEQGDPEKRYILAHELGHIVLHSNYKFDFTPIDEYKKTFVPDEQHSEWQANTFACHFLAPARFISKHTTPDDLALQFDFPIKWAKDYIETKIIHVRSYIGEACPNCASFALVGNSSSLTCDVCGTNDINPIAAQNLKLSTR